MLLRIIIARMSEKMVYLNGRLVPADKATISVFDAGFLHGESTFTTMLARNGVVFRLERHLCRLIDTAAMLDIRCGATSEVLTEAVYELLTANKLDRARLRVTLTPGPKGGDEPTTLITAEPLGVLPAEWYTEGITVVVSQLKQLSDDPTYGYKTGCYLPRVLARRQAVASGADEALWYTSDDRLAEACFCNVFLVRGGKVCTPPLDTPVLSGVVREVVIELCSQLDLPCDAETPLTARDALAAEEVFLSSSCSGVRPVVHIEQHKVGDGKPGPITRRLMGAYEKLLNKECSAYNQQEGS